MEMFEQLESRLLMSVSVTAGQLTIDQNAIISAKTAYLASIQSIGNTLLSDSQALEPLLPPGKSNLALGKKAVGALKKVLSSVQKETNKLANDSVSLSAKAVTAGMADITTPGTKNDAKVQKAGLALINKTRADEAKIASDQSLINFYADLHAIVLANPSATAFATGVQNVENDVPINAVPNAEANLDTAIFTLTTHLGVSS